MMTRYNKESYTNSNLVLFNLLTMEERELSVVFAVPATMYTSLYLTLSAASDCNYTSPRKLIKNSIKEISTLPSSSFSSYIRTIQDDYGFIMERKTIIQSQMQTCLYKHVDSKLTLFLEVCNKISLEDNVTININNIEKYTQTLRDFIYCRNNGIRISIERQYNEYHDPDKYQMNYDCFNRYNYDCFIHIEYEYNKYDEVQDVLNQFIANMCEDKLIFQLFSIVSHKNLNNVSDEMVNIQSMNLVHKYGYSSGKHLKSQAMDYYALKYDGVRHNFCIYGKYLQIGQYNVEFEHHWFGQVIIGHGEILSTGEIIIIDIYLVAENFEKISKKLNISYTSTLQSYHKFYTDALSSNGNQGTKTQDEYFHIQRLNNNKSIEYINPLDAIKYLQILQQVWTKEHTIAATVRLQKFYNNLKDLRHAIELCDISIDGYLAFNSTSIYKLKQKPTIDLVFRFDEMFRSIYKHMKSNQHELKKIIKYNNIQKTFNWLEFEHKFPGKFNIYLSEFLFFSHNKNFLKHYNDWSVYINIEHFTQLLGTHNGTSFILLLEFNIERSLKQLIFTRLRTDKFSANSIHVFKDILKHCM